MRAHSERSSQFRLLLVMPSHQLVRKGTELGFRIWSLWDPALLDEDFRPLLEEFSEELLLADFGDEDALRALIARTARTHDLDVVLHCGHGSSVLPVAREAWRLGLTPNPPQVHERLRGCEAVAAPAEAPRVSVQTLTVDGTHHLIGLTAQRTTGAPDFHLTGHLHPAPLPERTARQVTAAVKQLLTASGYRSGPAHSQVALLPLGPRVVSCRAQPAGDRIPLLIEIARGCDPERALFAGLLGSRPVVGPAERYAEVGFFLLPEGRLETYTGTEEIAVSPWVCGARFPYRAGDPVAPVGDRRSHRAYVVVEGETPELTRARVAEARRDLIAEVRPSGP
ncbi:Phosphoribosylglycinamide synthetase [Kitasatospora sp. MMS16-BH015]|uniref:phosphoribosylglycinamide synthetase n=1 Tax=Kitasatospora sp. MMS16-BH015 TaxID=2018025 RepID=UPI000CA0FC9B|nr:phosphoribosylglycinamide synthetase [Kitasatospora sp. MMS16-BH015]AUG78728.1 Phosphoribosylglycinamide synthetase [Kitasatospora sp. MMS16-BH015]